MKALPDFTHLAVPGTDIHVRVTPRAAQNTITMDETGKVSIRVTVAPEHGKANVAAQNLLGQAIGVAKSRLTLVRGATSRNKVFRVI